MVHHNAKYDSFESAVSKPDGLLVLGVFFELGKTENAAIHHLIKSVRGASHHGISIQFKWKNSYWKGLLPSDRDSFYRYKGSLTTPTCDESVLWIVFTKPQTISADQVRKQSHSFHQSSIDNLHLRGDSHFLLTAGGISQCAR